MDDFKKIAKKLGCTETELVARVSARIKINQAQEEARAIYKNRKNRQPVRVKKI